MRRKDIIRLLDGLDEQDAVKLSEAHLTLSEQEHARILDKVAQRMQDGTGVQIRHTVPVPARTSGLERLSHAVTAAACVAVFGGTFAGIFWLNTHAPTTREDVSQTSLPDGSRSHMIGERYAADNLTASGTLYVTVTDAVREGGLCRVDIVLESENAVSYAADPMGDPALFFADNFRLAAGDTLVSPCRMQPEGALPYTFTLRTGETCTLSLWYPADGPQQDRRFLAGTSPDAPYTVIDWEE